MSDTCYLGMDVGSGSVKVMVVRSDGEPVGMASHGYETSYPHHGHVEQNPEDWYQAACIATKAVLQQTQVSPERIAGIGLSGTSHVPSMLDAEFHLVRPSILWNDTRSDSQVRRLGSTAGELISAATGNSINCTWSLAQLAWIREHEPAVYSRIRHVLFSKDYLAFRLTGELAADYSSAVSSLMVDAHTLAWDRRLLDLVGLKPEAVSAIYPSTTIIGQLTSEAAADAGLKQGIPVVIGMLDSAAELLGVGATDPTVAVIRLGTAGGVMTLTAGPEWLRGCMLYPHPVPPYWYYQAGTNAATTSLQWTLNLFNADPDDHGYGHVDDLSRQTPAGANGLLFHPYLLGERAPYWSSHIRGGFSGATISHGRAEFVRAALEGVAYSLRDCAGLLPWGGVSHVRLCGGGAKSLAWCHIISDVLGLPVDQMQLQDASTLGAALAAVAGCGGMELRLLSRSGAHASFRIEPDGEAHEVYESGFRRYREIADQYLRTFEGG